MCRGDRALGGMGRVRGQGLFSICKEGDIGEKGHGSFNSQKLRLPHCWKTQA